MQTLWQEKFPDFYASDPLVVFVSFETFSFTDEVSIQYDTQQHSGNAKVIHDRVHGAHHNVQLPFIAQ